VDDDFLVLNGDVVVDASLPRVLANADGGPRLRRPKLSIHVRMAYSTAADGSLTKIVEKPANPPTNLANVGCYAFTPEVFEYIDRTPESERGEYGSRRRSNCCSTTATGLTWRPTWGRGSTSVARGSC